MTTEPSGAGFYAAMEIARSTIETKTLTGINEEITTGEREGDAKWVKWLARSVERVRLGTMWQSESIVRCTPGSPIHMHMRTETQTMKDRFIKTWGGVRA